MNAYNFDWVTARNECSLEKAFEKLRLDVKADVDKRQALRVKPPSWDGFEYGFNYSSNTSAFSASIHASNRSSQGVIFRLEPAGYIAVLNKNDEELFRATVTLDNERQCKFVVDGVELEDWQFRKKALEHIFFGELSR
jgi:hypothetical protein